jgi:hypothetical protein
MATEAVDEEVPEADEVVDEAVAEADEASADEGAEVVVEVLEINSNISPNNILLLLRAKQLYMIHILSYHT